MTRQAQIENAMFLAGLLFLIGLAPLLAGAVMLWRRLATLWRGALVEAEVTRWETFRLPAAVKRAPNPGGPRARSTARPWLRYVGPDGQTFVARLDQQLHRREWARYPVGSRMKVRIDPALPHIAFSADATSMWVFPGLLLFAGTLATLLGLGVWFGAPSPH